MSCSSCVQRHLAEAELVAGQKDRKNAVVWHLLRAAEMTSNNILQRELERARIDFQRTGDIPDWDFLRSITHE